MSQNMQEFTEQDFEGQDLENQVRRRAYELWEQEGRPEDRSDEFWFRAMQELRGTPGIGGPSSATAGKVDYDSE